MNILLITTSPNGILDKLQIKQNICLKVVDSMNFMEDDGTICNKLDVKSNILTAVKEILDNWETDVILTYRCPCILPIELFSRAKKAALNIHPSLLPKYIGANPWKEIYEKKEKESGVTIHFINEEVDAGPIIMQRQFSMDYNHNIKWHRSIVEDIASSMLEDILLRIRRSGTPTIHLINDSK